MKLKTCSRCHIKQPEDEFYLNSHCSSGRVNVCRTCKKEQHAARQGYDSTLSELLLRWGTIDENEIGA